MHPYFCAPPAPKIYLHWGILQSHHESDHMGMEKSAKGEVLRFECMTYIINLIKIFLKIQYALIEIRIVNNKVHYMLILKCYIDRLNC